MHLHLLDTGLENWHDFEVESRREIIALLRGIGNKKQMIRMVIAGEAELSVTTVVDVDDEHNWLVLDASVNAEHNARALEANGIGFETTLDKIRILFSGERAEACMFDGKPALRIALPATLIRLQRREYYRMQTPVSNPVRLVIARATPDGGSLPFPLADISCGGIALLDNKLLLGENPIGQLYPDCRLDLPEIGTVVTSLQVRNSLDMKLLNDKFNRRLGCQFVDLPRPMLNHVQRYITKLERERNARIAGRE